MLLKNTLEKDNYSFLPAAFYLKSFNPTFKMTLHTHDYFEIMYAVSGSFKIVTSALENGEEHLNERTITEGQFVFIDSNCKHYLKIFENCKICNIEIKLEKKSSSSPFLCIRELKQLPSFCSFATSLKEAVVLNDNENLLSLIKRIHYSIDKDKEDIESEYHIQGLLLVLFIDIARCHESSKLKFQSIYMTKCLNIINNNISDSLSPKKIASVLNISESYLHRQFKLHLNTTFSRYVNDYRISLAKNLLENSNDSISKISESIGFSTRQYFNKVFVSMEKVSPMEYRKAHKQKQYNIALGNYSQRPVDENDKQEQS